MMDPGLRAGDWLVIFAKLGTRVAGMTVREDVLGGSPKSPRISLRNRERRYDQTSIPDGPLILRWK